MDASRCTDHVSSGMSSARARDVSVDRRNFGGVVSRDHKSVRYIPVSLTATALSGPPGSPQQSFKLLRFVVNPIADRHRAGSCRVPMGPCLVAASLATLEAGDIPCPDDSNRHRTDAARPERCARTLRPLNTQTVRPSFIVTRVREWLSHPPTPHRICATSIARFPRLS